MANIVFSIVANVAKYLVEPAIREGQYFLCVNKVIEDLENEKEELTYERDSMQDRVEQAKEKTEVIAERVEKWMTDVKNLLEEVADLEQRMRANTGCFQGLCPIWRRYRLCKQMVKKTEAMRKFKDKRNIQPFSHPAPLPGPQYHSSENFTYFGSTKVAYDQLLEALQDDGIYMVGVYGMGGSGKTTLVTEVGKKFDELNLFDKVLLITVSQTPKIKDIQGEMADMLKIKLKEESEKGRAQRLWLSLKEKKRVLVIADDLWRQFNLEGIGIRLDNDRKGLWKVLIATRNENACDSMDCQKKIHLGLLREDESWTLFQKHANINDNFSKSLVDIPRKLCYECKGLPIAIITVGSSLKGKSNADWRLALRNLRDWEAFDDHMDEGVRDALSCLELSYDYLPNEEAKLLFLMCSMFPEDYNISMEVLIRYAIGVGLGGTLSLDLARDVIEANINKLLQSCLLMHAEKGKNYVKMHDMVRDTALWIAKRSKNRKILVNLDKALTTMAEDDTLRDYFAVSSWYSENQIFCQLDAPNLEILLLNMDIEGSFDLSNATFEGIQRLKVFSAINKFVNRRLLLPQSNQLLKNLQTLHLENWELGDLSFIACLTRLEILDLKCCTINELPNEIGKLKKLKLLDLSTCDIQENCIGAIGKCSQLEELYFTRHPQKGYHVQSIVDIITLPKLQRFEIITDFSFQIFLSESTEVLTLGDFNISNLSASKRNLFQIAKTVCVRCLHGGCKNIIPDLVRVVGDMNGLTYLILFDCQEIECIFDSEIEAIIPRLVELQLQRMENLKELCRGPPLQVLSFFERLETLHISDCPQLHSLFPWECNLANLKILEIYNTPCSLRETFFSTFVAQSLLQLEELTIDGFDELKHIIASEREHGSNTSEEIVPAPTNFHFVMPKLKKFRIGGCGKLESIFQIYCVEGQIQLPLLEDLSLYRLENLVRICPENNGAKWPSLRFLAVSDCPKLTASWIAMMVGSKQRQQHLIEQKHLPSILKYLSLQGLPQLNLISWVGPTPRQILSFQHLQYLEVDKCENVKFLFSMEVHGSLPELISFHIYGCQELEQIIAENEEVAQLPDAEVYFPRLKNIYLTNCNKLKSLFSVAMVNMLPQLSTLSIENATQLEEVFRHCNGDDTINEMEIVLPNLTEIELHNLPSFVDIGQGCKLQAMKLQKLDLRECRKTAPSLRAIQYYNIMGMPAVEESYDKMEAFLSQNINTMDIHFC